MVEQMLERDPAYEREFQRTLEIISQYSDFVLTTHLNPDGDGLGCESALSLALQGMGKKVTVVNAHPLPDMYRFLPASETFRTESTHSTPHEVAILLECPDEARAGGIITRSQGVPLVVNLDHHVFNNRYGSVNLIDPTAAAVGEQVWDLLRALDCPVDKAMAVGIYTAIATDTGHFKYPSVTPRTHRIVAELLEMGLEIAYMNEQLYERVPAEALELLALGLSTVHYQSNRRVGYFSITQDMLTRSGAKANQTENFVNYVRAVDGVEVAVFFLETDSGQIKVSFRSRGRVDVSTLALQLGGGGHQRAAGALVSGPLGVAQKLVLPLVEKALAPM
jgi:bifunctional oligoribonuclease and PAP phosphatase NrnA